jgi:hypothetical protein
MKPYDLRSELELIPYTNPSASAVVSSESCCETVKPTGIVQLLQSVVCLLTHRQEPKIYRKSDRSGRLYYEIFDPVTGLHTALGTEQEVRTWLERRYY